MNKMKSIYCNIEGTYDIYMLAHISEFHIKH